MANLHDGEWSPEEEEVRSRRPFYVVPRYDKTMGGYVNIPVQLPTDGDEVYVDFDHRKKVIRVEDQEFDNDIRLEQMYLWGQSIPDYCIPLYRQRLLKKLATLRPDPQLEGYLAVVEVDEETQNKWPEPEKVENCSEEDLRFMMAKSWLTRAISHWLDVLGLNEPESEGGLAGDPLTTFDLDRVLISVYPSTADLLHAESPEDFVLVDET